MYSQSGRIHAWIPAQNMNQYENLLIEGATYDVNNFFVRRYPTRNVHRCFQNDIFIHFNHMTEVFVTGGVNYIPNHVFQFSDLSSVMEPASQNEFLIGEFIFLCVSKTSSLYDF